MDEPKFCKDCKHYDPHLLAAAWGVDIPASCLHPTNVRRDLVTARPMALSRPAELRGEGGNCGETGAMFEAAPTPPQPGAIVEIVRPDAPRGFLATIFPGLQR